MNFNSVQLKFTQAVATDGSKDSEGRVGWGAWCGPHQTDGQAHRDELCGRGLMCGRLLSEWEVADTHASH